MRYIDELEDGPHQLLSTQLKGIQHFICIYYFEHNTAVRTEGQETAGLCSNMVLFSFVYLFI
jgi:hypothetical protein